MSFFKYNNFTGRIAPSSQTAAYMPQGLQAEAAGETVFQFESTSVKRAQPAPEVVHAAAPQTKGPPRGVIPRASGYTSLLNLQKFMNIEDGHFVWQKRGGADKMPFLLTMGLIGITTLYGVSLIVKMSFPPKNQ